MELIATAKPLPRSLMGVSLIFGANLVRFFFSRVTLAYTASSHVKIVQTNNFVRLVFLSSGGNIFSFPFCPQ